MLPFQDPAYRLSGTDISNILKHCRLCFNITNKGQQIIDFKLLTSLKIQKKKKNAIILHAYQHWHLILIFNNHDAVLIDPLNTVQFSHPDVMQTILTFCKENSLFLHLFDCRHQSQTTNICGYLILWSLFKATKLSFSSFMKLKQTILLNNISTNERGMIYAVKRHFKL